MAGVAPVIPVEQIVLNLGICERYANLGITEDICMTRTLYLHIGAHRTATTSIQQFLLRNFDPLVKSGCLLPMRIARHFDMMNKLFANKLTAADAAADLNLRADKKNNEITKLILTDEDACMRSDLSPLAAFRDHFDVKVIYSLRRQDLWLESWYFQNIKWQWNPSLAHITFDEFLARREEFHWVHYDRYVRHLENMFGKENVLLSVFEKEQMPQGPIHAFLSQIGLEELFRPDETPHVNSSMSAAMVEFTRHLPLDAFSEAQRGHLLNALEAVDRTTMGNSAKQSERLLTPDRRRALLAEYEQGNTALAQRYFNRSELFLAPMPAPDAPLAQLKIPDDAASLIDRFVTPLLRQLILDGAVGKAAKRTDDKKGSAK